VGVDFLKLINNTFCEMRFMAPGFGFRVEGLGVRGSDRAGSYLRRMDLSLLYHSTRGLRVTKKKRRGSNRAVGVDIARRVRAHVLRDQAAAPCEVSGHPNGVRTRCQDIREAAPCAVGARRRERERRERDNRLRALRPTLPHTVDVPK